MGYSVTIVYSAAKSSLDPREKQLLIVGQPSYLRKLSFNEVQEKFAGRITEDVSWFCFSVKHTIATCLMFF